jgi:alpha-L-fucosidase 2
MATHTTDPYYYVQLNGKIKFGMWPVGGAWCTAHFMEHYRFTGDKDFLAKRAFPVLKESALFFLDWLVEEPDTGKLVSGPSCSPENRFTVVDENNEPLFTGQACMGPAMDQEVIWENFSNYLEAAEILGIDDEFTQSVRTALNQLKLPKIGKDGRLLEWGRDSLVEIDPGHRHVSHLYAVYPSAQFSWSATPELMQASRKSLIRRLMSDGGQTGWSRAWTINFWARFLEGEYAHDNVVIALQHNSFDNLLNVNPPFIIDGNFGYSAGIAEMLIQSHEGDVHLLPAVPSAWASGSFRGLCARGGFEVDLTWKDGRIVEGSLLSKLGSGCTLRFNGKSATFKTEAGKRYDIPKAFAGSKAAPKGK